MDLKRKLAAILSADVKGYSRLMGDDEEATVRTITAYREVMNTIIRDHRGRVVDSPGDNLLAEFSSAVDAVRCATEIQDALQTRNAELPLHRRMVFRIGINIGDVIIEEGAIYGDGVNIAARLEGLADPGGICISGTAYDQVKRKLDLGYEFMGDQAVKNIAEPVRAYRVLWRDHKIARGGIEKRGKGSRPVRAGPRKRLLRTLVITCFLMTVIMPFVNHLRINLLTKIWQCRLTLLPNSMDVTLVTIGKDENRKMNVKNHENRIPSFEKDPKLWRRYHSTVIRNLFNMGAGVVGFDFWFSPAYDDQTRKATKKFIQGLKWAKARNFPVVVGQYRNTQDRGIYEQADWGYISVHRDLTWINEVTYLMAWDRLDLSGIRVEKPSLFVQALARKLRLKPFLEGSGVRLIGKTIPRRLWLAFAETPFVRVPYHEVYNGWADKRLFSDKIVLIGLNMKDTDFFKVPYSPTDFTPHDPADSPGMPGVFLFANAINQIMNGYYHIEVNDEWSWPGEGEWFSTTRLESLFFLLLETLATCVLLFFVYVLAERKGGPKSTYTLMGLVTAVFITALALTPVLFGLANFLCASILFSLVFSRGKTSKGLVRAAML
ncbi:MAG: CHASE2 domain-containing protein [Deltaproteobacteria bacterium]|nr:CHASE2 domain-containing protein [Deltaproteobacteria bacterium]MBW2049538.1 CHASE2 domain-containing protein [Deltaproteobacteria bacterium]MBW2113116.1 CHASE2 domain-containing protein [Deltaproteobacteria bacterium]MBW2352309.1 CHASE2 domain-containing protein [Deltaproteobacteria bacterium]